MTIKKRKNSFLVVEETPCDVLAGRSGKEITPLKVMFISMLSIQLRITTVF